MKRDYTKPNQRRRAKDADIGDNAAAAVKVYSQDVIPLERKEDLEDDDEIILERPSDLQVVQNNYGLKGTAANKAKVGVAKNIANQGIVVLDTKNQAVVSDTRPQSQLTKKIVYDDSNFQCNKKLPNS